MTARLLLASVLIACSTPPLSATLEGPPSNQPVFGNDRTPGRERVWRRLTEYSIKARVPILGDIGHVGTFAIEAEVRRTGDFQDRVFRIFGRSKPELAKKGKDYSGELEMVRALPIEGEGGRDEMEVGIAGTAISSSSGYFKKNGVSEAESIAFYPDYAVSRRENGSEKRVEGSCGCLISAMEHFLEHEIREGDVYESRFVFGGARVFPIDFTTYDGVEKDEKGMPKIVKKKGGIRLWLSKEGPYKDTYLRLMIQYKWYLTLHLEMVKST